VGELLFIKTKGGGANSGEILTECAKAMLDKFEKLDAERRKFI